MFEMAASRRTFCASSSASRARSCWVRSTMVRSRLRLTASISSIISDIERSVRSRSRSNSS
jgi:hypothetical protein